MSIFAGLSTNGPYAGIGVRLSGRSSGPATANPISVGFGAMSVVAAGVLSWSFAVFCAILTLPVSAPILTYLALAPERASKSRKIIALLASTAVCVMSSILVAWFVWYVDGYASRHTHPVGAN